VQGPRAAASGEAQALYLTARGLVRSRDPEDMQTAVMLLREALSRDPDFAPAWAKLGTATALSADRSDAERANAAHDEAISYVRRALALDPQLAEAHGTLGMLLGFETQEAARHIRTAAELDPNDAEIQFWRGHVYLNDLDFENQLAAYRRASDLDPMWRLPAADLMRVAIELGRHREAEAELRRFGNVTAPGRRRLLEAYFARLRNDFSEAARGLEEVRRSSHSERHFASLLLGQLLRDIRLDGIAASLQGMAAADASDPYGDPPNIAAVRGSNASGRTAFAQFEYLVRAVNRLVASGRAAPLADLFDRRAGLLRLSAVARPRPASLVTNGDTVALVLRQAGREQDARTLLAAAQAQIRRTAAGPVPGWFHGEAAEIWAASGRSDEALASLERAVDAGWLYGGRESMDDIADEPAFAGLRTHPRFLRVRQRIAAHLQRERQEIRQALPHL
ncbi:MAG: hypothetical protein M3177_05820, partial [Pseudomonadota bacterium]|nr:hypothetical protein [Pseudomonadota bacterium]